MSAKGGKMRPHAKKEEPLYYEQGQVVAAAKKIFLNTPGIIMVEVFQSGATSPIAVFQ